ncbi:MAG TPA: cyclic nucleotide-binding domain-containing protein [Pyrinomonadaceae bacterium]|jgi:Fe-S-cluster-containing dehydrogenase component/CRP-like cAMP-binding protein|nr:cyclic nucleotide-binding domain-containing protein [Pyrinomonadaceae bacterium]
MPREITDKDAILSGLKSLELTSELFVEVNGKLKNQGDLDVIVEGKVNASGKRVGPYVRLLAYDSGEAIMRQGEWGGNTFYLSVSGALDVYIGEPGGEQRKISRLLPGTCFGEMAVLAGVERNATVIVPKNETAIVLEVTRPALRLLRKLPKFGLVLDETYRAHGLGRVLEDLTEHGRTANEAIIRKLREIGKFMVYGKHHVLCQETEPLQNIILIKSGWIRRVRGVPLDPASTGVAVGMGQTIGVDFLGAGNCLGLEGFAENETWKYSASAMARTEVLEIPLAPLAADPKLREQIVAAFAAFSTVDDSPPSIEAVEDLRAMASAEAEITTGIVDGANLLVMDMDLCIRCGNCSLACHKVHGQSRLLRRGISITRPVTIGSERTQHVLSPQVCMHCKDPECLTGCPTGSIFRDPRGYVDIDPATCIGCFDCATQCPYDAISMVPKNGEPVVTFDLMGTLRKTFSLSTPPAAPLQLTPADDLVAIKCNLCEHTPLNPQGAERQAYSCEENCPTGALLRVDPVRYFTEVDKMHGLIFRDQTQAFGRNIHKSDPLAKAFHVSGVVLILLATVAIVWGLAARGFDGVLWGTWLTMRWVTGLVGLFGIAAVMTYPLRKQVYRRRAGALRYWMLMHVYIGALAGLILMLHAGSHTGGLLTTSLYIAFDAVIASGLFGIASYIMAPRILTSIEGEPLLIEDLVARRAELRQEFDEITKQSEGWLKEEIEKQVARKFSSFSFLMRQFMRREQLTALLANARRAFKERLTRLATNEERTLLLRAVETAVTLRRVEALIQLHKLLKLWIAPHVISTSVMLALMVVHVIQVVYFAVK